MAWIIQNAKGGPVLITDLGITLHGNQTRDLDLVGRDTAEKSRDLKEAFANKLIIELRKDEIPKPGETNALALAQAQQAATQASAAAQAAQAAIKVQQEAMLAQTEALKAQTTKIDTLHQTIAAQQDGVKAVLDEVKNFAARYPEEAIAIKRALENIQKERGAIAEQREALKTSAMSEAEIKAHERILAQKDKRLEKNYDTLGKTVSESSSSVDEALDALDEAGV